MARSRRGLDGRQLWAAAFWLGLMILLAFLMQLLRGPGALLSGPIRIIDGDSLVLDGREVRLVGIDAPEGRQACTQGGREWRCGEASRAALQRLVGSDAVECRSVERDQHGRDLARCTAGGRDLNRSMVAEGFAVAFGSDYRREEAAAREARRGLWAGEFEPPREWRRRNGIGR
jgi:endonuclease YncB( thermonuclease family)